MIDQKRFSNEQKLRWIEQEIGKDADLVTFSAKFLDVFGEKLSW